MDLGLWKPSASTITRIRANRATVVVQGKRPATEITFSGDGILGKLRYNLSRFPQAPKNFRPISISPQITFPFVKVRAIRRRSGCAKQKAAQLTHRVCLPLDSSYSVPWRFGFRDCQPVWNYAVYGNCRVVIWPNRPV
jgi:hypothetical protein